MRAQHMVGRQCKQPLCGYLMVMFVRKLWHIIHFFVWTDGYGCFRREYLLCRHIMRML